MELRHLRYFVVVAEEQNVSRAAARLHVSQPPLSRQIRNLEQEIGIALFHRITNKLCLTDAGLAFLKEARIILKRANDAVKLAKDISAGKRGEIQIGYAPSLTVALLPRTLKYFRQSNPDVDVKLHDMSTREMLNGLADGKLHAAMLVETEPVAGLTFDELERHPVCVALHPMHRLAKARRVGLENLVGEHTVALCIAEYPEYHAWIKRMFLPFGQAPKIVEEHDSFTGLVAAVESGKGVAIIAQPPHGLATTRLKFRRLDPAPPPLGVGIAYRTKLRSKATDDFICATKKAKTL